MEPIRILNNFQEKAISIFMDKFGIDAGVEAIALYERNGSLGAAMIKVAHKNTKSTSTQGEKTMNENTGIRIEAIREVSDTGVAR